MSHSSFAFSRMRGVDERRETGEGVMKDPTPSLLYLYSPEGGAMAWNGRLKGRSVEVRENTRKH
jgi:hypothetical protein